MVWIHQVTSSAVLIISFSSLNFDPSMKKCFISRDKGAENATRLYDDNKVNGVLWDRDHHPGPLPNCTSTRFPALDSDCLVCRNQAVFAVCKDLPDDVKMMMEHPNRSINISVSLECPQLAAELSSSAIACICCGIIIIILIILGVIGFLYYRRRKRSNPPRSSSNGPSRMENGTNEGNESHVLNEVSSSPDQRDEDEAPSASRLFMETGST